MCWKKNIRKSLLILKTFFLLEIKEVQRNHTSCNSLWFTKNLFINSWLISFFLRILTHFIIYSHSLWLGFGNLYIRSRKKAKGEKRFKQFVSKIIIIITIIVIYHCYSYSNYRPWLFWNSQSSIRFAKVT